MVIQEILFALWDNFLAFIPNLLAAFIILIIGLFVGKGLGRLTREILSRAKIDHWITDEGKMHFKLSNVFDVIIRWVIYLVFIKEATQQLGVVAISDFVSSVISVLPGLIEAALLIIIGYTLAIYIKDKIMHSKTLYSDMVGKIVFFLLIYLSIALALPFVNIDPSLINSMLLIVIGGISLGLAVALGLGLKDLIRETAKNYAKRFRGKKRR
ncbi:MAG: hypothetical protein ISS95_01295 [Candidatus Aenigmarchaeota archaeon]|nr:hypothetical protein [Candidatus Aenigmarchaeota archaeon]